MWTRTVEKDSKVITAAIKGVLNLARASMITLNFVGNTLAVHTAASFCRSYLGGNGRASTGRNGADAFLQRPWRRAPPKKASSLHNIMESGRARSLCTHFAPEGRSDFDADSRKVGRPRVATLRLVTKGPGMVEKTLMSAFANAGKRKTRTDGILPARGSAVAPDEAHARSRHGGAPPFGTARRI